MHIKCSEESEQLYSVKYFKTAGQVNESVHILLITCESTGHLPCFAHADVFTDMVDTKSVKKSLWGPTSLKPESGSASYWQSGPGNVNKSLCFSLSYKTGKMHCHRCWDN